MPKPGTESKLGPSLRRCRPSVPATISPDRLLLSLFNLPHAYFVLRVFGLRGEHGLSQALQIKSNTYFLRQLAGESCGLAIVGPPVVCFDHHPHSGIMPLIMSTRSRLAAASVIVQPLAVIVVATTACPITASNPSRSAMAMPRHVKQDSSQFLILLLLLGENCLALP